MRHGPSPAIYAVRLCVVERVAADTWKYLHCTAVQTIPTTAGIEQFPADMRIRKGRYISMVLSAGDHPLITHSTEAESADVQFFPAPALGVPTMPTSRATNYEYLWNATVRRLK